MYSSPFTNFSPTAFPTDSLGCWTSWRLLPRTTSFVLPYRSACNEQETRAEKTFPFFLTSIIKGFGKIINTLTIIVRFFHFPLFSPACLSGRAFLLCGEDLMFSHVIHKSKRVFMTRANRSRGTLIGEAAIDFIRESSGMNAQKR